MTVHYGCTIGNKYNNTIAVGYVEQKLNPNFAY